MSLRATLSSYWCAFQEYLFPTIEADLGPLGERYQAFITVLEFVRVEQHLPGAVTGAVVRSKTGRRWRAPSSPRRCSRSTPPGPCASG